MCKIRKAVYKFLPPRHLLTVTGIQVNIRGFGYFLNSTEKCLKIRKISENQGNLLEFTIPLWAYV